MRGKKGTVLTFAEKCKNILASNWQGYLNTIKADSKGSKEDIYTSKVEYIIKKGKPYIWVPEKDLHNMFPSRVALTGDVVPLKEEKAKSAAGILRDIIHSEQETISESPHTVSGVLSSSALSFTSRIEHLQQLLADYDKYLVYKFDMSSCTFIDCNGGKYEVDIEDMETSKADSLAPFSARLIDGINQSDARRRALMLFCFVHFNTNAKDAYILSVDRKGFDVLGKVAGQVLKDGSPQYQWKEFRFTFKEEARDVESFCCQLVEMEEDAVKEVSSYSGLG